MVRTALAIAFVLAATSATAAPPDAAAHFEKVIRPLLLKQCVSCHGEQKQKGQLRLDSLAAMLEGGESGPAVVPGKPEQSLMIAALKHGEQLKMPPKEKLPDADIAALTAWVKAGAVWPDAKPTTPKEAKPTAARAFTAEEKAFWAFQPRRPATTATIDDFIQKSRDAAKLKAAPEADKLTLIRRITFDLTGLPPTSDETDAFLKDDSPTAWDKVIDRLLASSAYGEKWGRRWLDVARYADSNGMDENIAHGNAWRYRDYVIRSFNADKPYDRFVKEQVAGDLLPGDTDKERADALTATGFLVVGPKMLAEDDPVKMRMDIIDEQLDTLGQAFLGLTLGCARCHDHKFDPITQHDYYSLAGIFYSTKTMQHYNVVARWHERAIGSAESQAAISEYEKKRTAAADAVKKAERKLRDAVKARLTEERKRTREYAEAALQLAKAGGPPKLVSDPSKDKPAGMVLVEAENYTRGNALKLTTGYGEGIGVIINAGPTPNVAEYDLDLPADGTYQVAIRYAAAEPRSTKLIVNGKQLRGDAAGERTGSWNPDKQVWFAEAVVALPKGKVTVRLERDGAFPHFDKFAILPLTSEQVKALPPTAEKLAAEKKLLPGALAAWAKLAASWKAVPAAEELAKLAADPNGPFRSTPALESEVDDKLATALRGGRDQLASIEKTRPPVDEVMAVEDDKLQNLRIHLRGSHLTLGPEVPRRFPAILIPEMSPLAKGSGRLELAEWLASPANPLTARVMANRVWVGHFGRGLVRSPDNFGKLGERPTHPELLDHLANELVRSGWSVKHLHRLILKSQTYRMGTDYDANSFRADPDNRLYWRFNRRRLDAEEQRDGMLAVAGILDRTMGGSLLPGQNRNYVNNAAANKTFDEYAKPRRTVYLPVLRSGVADVLQANDFPDPSVPAGQRNATTVPSQALLMLNSPMADQASEAFAKFLIALNPDDATRVRAAYRRAYGRDARPAEVTRAQKYLADAKAGGELPAWRGLCRALFASVEFSFVE